MANQEYSIEHESNDTKGKRSNETHISEFKSATSRVFSRGPDPRGIPDPRMIGDPQSPTSVPGAPSGIINLLKMP